MAATASVAIAIGLWWFGGGVQHINGFTLKVYFSSDSQRVVAAANLFASGEAAIDDPPSLSSRAGLACSSLPVPPTLGLHSVSKLYLVLIVFGVLMTLAWIVVLVWATIYLAQHVFGQSERPMQSDVFPWAVAAAIAVTAALGVWLVGTWFGGGARAGFASTEDLV